MAAMGNYPYSSSFMQSLPAWPMKKAADLLGKSSSYELANTIKQLLDLVLSIRK